MKSYRSTTAEILVKIETLIHRELTDEEETPLIDSIEAIGIVDPYELIKMYDLD